MDETRAGLKQLRIRGKKFDNACIKPEPLLQLVGWEKSLEIAAFLGRKDILDYINKMVINKFALLIDREKLGVCYRALACALENRHTDLASAIGQIWFFDRQVIRERAESDGNEEVLEFLSTSSI